MEVTAERIEKLPAWARMHIQRLTNKIDDLEIALSIANKEDIENASGALTVEHGLSTIEEAVVLPDHATIKFNFGKYDYIGLHHDREEGVVRVYAHPGVLHVLPRSGNAILLAPESRYVRNKASD